MDHIYEYRVWDGFEKSWCKSYRGRASWAREQDAAGLCRRLISRAQRRALGHMDYKVVRCLVLPEWHEGVEYRRVYLFPAETDLTPDFWRMPVRK